MLGGVLTRCGCVSVFNSMYQSMCLQGVSTDCINKVYQHDVSKDMLASVPASVSVLLL